MNMAQVTLDALKAVMADNIVALRYAGIKSTLTGQIAEAFCSGVERAYVVTDQGIVNGVDGNVRYILTDEPAAWAVDNAINGEVVEMQFAGTSTWQRFRVVSRKPLQGGVRLNLSAEFDT